MLLQIIQRTPLWVFGLFFALLALGLSQLSTRQVTLRRLVVLPVAMTGLSLYGTVSTFGLSALPLLSWTLAALAAGTVLGLRAAPAGTAYDPSSARFTVPGSMLPLTLYMGIFFTKYAVGMVLALNPTLAQDSTFMLIACTIYGTFSGLFNARSLRILRQSSPGLGLGMGRPAQAL